MQAVILAAGMGSRLGKYTQNSTKCMVKVGGHTLLERIFNSLRKAGVSKAVIVTGYCADKLTEHAIKAAGDDISVTFIYNDKYNITNNIYSLYLASEYMMQEDSVLFESDLIFDETIVTDILNDPSPDLVTVSRFENWMDGTVTTFDEFGNVTSFIDKSNFIWDNCMSYYKTVNIYKLSADFFKNWYHPFLEAYIKTCGNNAYYEMVLKVITNINSSKLKALDITGKKWYEIDTPQDLQTAETLFAEENQLEDLKKRYGGYWRFHNLKDYCYLVNPWFPTQELKNEIKHSFSELITQYPSGQSVIRTAMASLLECSEDYISVGNGAAELIKLMGQIISGRYFLTMPSFNEYVSSFSGAERITLDTGRQNFSYNADDIINASKNADTVVIINPDNPSGNFIQKNDMLRLLDICSARGQKIIVDESFIDFADPEIRYTLINDEILQKYPSLAVVKSISKSYGVPGIRLGALCSSDKAFISKINSLLPIWNINSYGEYFLQVCAKYRKEYKFSCDEIAAERKRFAKLLTETGKLEVYPSQANFIMCRLKSGSAEALAQSLIKDRFFIKDLKSKEGCSAYEMIRLAVKTPEENDLLVSLISEKM